MIDQLASGLLKLPVESVKGQYMNIDLQDGGCSVTEL